MKTLLITRPRQEAKIVADLLAARDFSSFTEPLLRIEHLRKTLPDLTLPLQAILATSRHAITALRDRKEARSIPLFVVGEASAEIARHYGFAVAGVAGTADELISMIRSHCLPDKGPLFYARGQDISTSLSFPLVQAGFSVRENIIYRALPASRFSVSLCEKLLAGSIAGALFFSRRTADIYASLALAHDLESPHRAMQAICISETVAEQARSLPWRALHVAAHPDIQHMIETAANVCR